MFHYLMYVSYAVEPLADMELHDLLEKCRKNNNRRKITGMLMYVDGRFIQVLEGARKNINEMYNLILEDPRHKKVTKIIEGRSLTRRFSNWTMGVKSLPGKPDSGFEELGDYFRNAEINENSHVTHVFLRLFYNKYCNKPELISS